MPKPISYVRVFTDGSGETHLERLALELATKTFAPPAAPLDVSALTNASTFSILRLGSDWRGEWHPTPVRQWRFFLEGSASLEVSDGSVHKVSAGSIVLLEDVTGKGHHTVVNGSEVIIAAVQVPA